MMTSALPKTAPMMIVQKMKPLKHIAATSHQSLAPSFPSPASGSRKEAASVVTSTAAPNKEDELAVKVEESDVESRSVATVEKRSAGGVVNSQADVVGDELSNCSSDGGRDEEYGVEDVTVTSCSAKIDVSVPLTLPGNESAV